MRSIQVNVRMDEREYARLKRLVKYYGKLHPELGVTEGSVLRMLIQLDDKATRSAQIASRIRSDADEAPCSSTSTPKPEK